MSDITPTLHIAAQFTNEATFVSKVRPYQNRVPPQVAFKTAARHEKLPEDDTWRVELDVVLEGMSEDARLYSARVSQEFIVVVKGLEGEELDRVLMLQVPARMFAYARTQLATLSLNTGYGPLTLPPVPDAYILQANKTEI